ncbi:MAG: helix-turn-helix transcriptional regulator [Clostridia bacterium]|nr:helix-turn-helix transcriptional regulator [Clostridia bacterium]MBQ6803800.1 helix-turn-helix transcriptional regulator [Clostridia bacterium]MDD6681956.1 helix-turn-helix transcriptional regulator [Clostridiales bacterium]
MVDYVAMGQKMRSRRRFLKISQEELAKAVQISPSFYGNIERGIRIPSIDTLVAIANALQVGVDYFLVDSLDAVFTRRSSEENKILTRFLREQIAELEFDVPAPEQDNPSSQE